MSWSIAAAREAGGLAGLQPLVEAVFGAGDRPAGWFGRKLARECLDDALTRVAFVGDDPTDPRAWIGFVLAGRPPSRRPAVRAAGVGVLAAWRRRGVAAALLDSLAAASVDLGATAIEVAASPGALPLYRACGFVDVQATTTLLAFGRGAHSPSSPPTPWDTPRQPLELHGYLQEAWERTPDAERTTLAWPELAVTHHVCREGRAFAVHRTVTASTGAHALDAAFDHLLERLPDGAPVLALAVPLVSSITGSLRSAGWVDVQYAAIVRRPL